MGRYRSPTSRLLLVAAVALAVLVAACGATPEDEASRAPAPAAEPTPTDERDGRADPQPSPDPPDAGVLAPGLDVTLPAVGGGQVVGAELAGRDVALWFWAPW